MDTFRISDADILRRLDSSEDSFVEKKSLGDMKDVVKTCVAFANTCAIEDPPGILCYGVRDDGTIESSTANLDSAQKKIKEKLSEGKQGQALHRNSRQSKTKRYSDNSRRVARDVFDVRPQGNR